MELKNRRLLAAALTCALAATGLVAVTSSASADHGTQTAPEFSSEVIDGQSATFTVAITVPGSDTATATITVDDGVGGTETQAEVLPAGDGTPREFTGVFNTATFADGPLSATSSVTDEAGNTTTTGPTTAILDSNAPVLSGVQISPDPIGPGDPATVSFTVSDASTSTVTVTLDDQDAGTPALTRQVVVSPGNNAGLSVQFTANEVDTLSDGTLTAAVTAVDSLGRASTVQTDEATLDTRNPLIDIAISPDTLGPNETTFTVSGTVSDSATVTVNVVITDDDVNTPNGQCTRMVSPGGTGVFTCGPFTASDFSDGTITATATAFDEAGNVGSDSDTAQKDTTVTQQPQPQPQDTTAPVITGTQITPDPITAANQTQVTVSAQVQEAATSTVRITLTSSTGGASLTRTVTLAPGGGAISEVFDVSSLGDGVITATVTATDASGNASSQTDTATKDTTTTGAPPAGGNNPPTATPSTSPSASPSTSPSASPSPATTTPPPTSASPSPTGSPSGPPLVACAGAEEIELQQTTIIATGSAGVTVRATPNSVVDLFAYTRPSTTYRVVRSAEIGANGVANFRIVPPANTRLYAQQRGCDATQSVVLNVRTALSLAVQRLGVRTYRFSGDSLPARPGGLIISLYRVTDGGRQVLTAQTRANDRNGEWSLVRRFTGTGRFGFVVRTGQDLQNAPGSSNVRSLLIF